MLIVSCKNNRSNDSKTPDKVVKVEKFIDFIKAHDVIFKHKNNAHLTLKKEDIYIGYYRDLENGIYTISITTHPKPYFISHDFFVDTINQKPIVFTNLDKLIFNNKRKYDSLMNTSLSQKLIKDSIISLNDRDAWSTNGNYVTYYFKKGIDKKKHILLDKNQLQDSIKKYGVGNIDFYEYMILPNQFK